MKRKNILITILTILYEVFTLIGTSFLKYNSFYLFYKYPLDCIFIFIVLFFIYFESIKMIFNYLDKLKNKRNKKIKKNRLFSRYLAIFNLKPFLISFITILICWLIYVIAFYPGILSKDPSFQILQYFHIDNKYSSYVNLIDPNVIITNHHPVIHTLLLGTCLNIGITLFHNTNIGIFIYSIIQILILSTTLSYTIKFMKDINISLKYRFIVLLIYSFVPVFPMYSLTIVKDVIYSSLVVIYIISIFKIITSKNKLSLKEIILEILLLVGIFLFRNNGIHLIILSFPFLLFSNKKNRFNIFIIIMMVLSLNIFYTKVLLPYFKITPTSIREMLSIPFQQTARYFKYHEDEISKEEKKKIDKVLEIDDIAKRYNPDKADPVKNKFNKNASKKDMKNYFDIWKKGLKKHPSTYIEATINNTYGYFYPLKINWYLYYNYCGIINEHGFNYHYNRLDSLRKGLVMIGLINIFIPIINLVINIGFNTWILLFMIMYLLYKKKYKELVVFIPCIITLLICIASPVNVYFRYSLPNIFVMPTLIAIFLYFIKNN